MMNPFSDSARRLIESSYELAREDKSRLITTAHFLHALVSESDCAGYLALKKSGVDVARVADETLAARSKNDDHPGIGDAFAPDTKRVIELSFEIAKKLGGNYIGTGHLLMGLWECPDSESRKILSGFDLKESALLEEIAKLTPLEQPNRLSFRERVANRFEKVRERIKNF